MSDPEAMQQLTDKFMNDPEFREQDSYLDRARIQVAR